MDLWKAISIVMRGNRAEPGGKDAPRGGQDWRDPGFGERLLGFTRSRNLKYNFTA